MPLEAPRRRRPVGVPEPVPSVPGELKVPQLLGGQESAVSVLPTARVRVDRIPTAASDAKRAEVVKAPEPAPVEPVGPTLSEQLQSLKDLFTEQGGDQDTMVLLDAATSRLLPFLDGRAESGLTFNPSDPAKSAGGQAQKTLQQVLVEAWNQRPQSPPVEVFMDARGNVDLPSYVGALSAYSVEYNAWLSGAVNTLNVQTDAATERLDTVAGFLSDVLQSGTAVKIEKLRQTGNLAGQLISMQQEFRNQQGLTRLQTDEAIRLARAQDSLNKERLKLEQDFMGEQNALDRAIELVKLDEVVRHNRGLERLERERLGLQERQNNMDFLGNLLASGGLSMFTLAMLSPEAAKAAITNVFGRTPGDFQVTSQGASPIEVAEGLRAQRGAFGEVQIPSIQQLAQSSPSMRAYQQRAFELEGRDLSEETGRLVPGGASGIPRRRAR